MIQFDQYFSDGLKPPTRKASHDFIGISVQKFCIELSFLREKGHDEQTAFPGFCPGDNCILWFGWRVPNAASEDGTRDAWVKIFTPFFRWKSKGWNPENRGIGRCSCLFQSDLQVVYKLWFACQSWTAARCWYVSDDFATPGNMIIGWWSNL